MVIYLYRWKLKAGSEEDFSKGWAFVTEALKTRAGSLGSRLHVGSDGLHYGYAQWPDKLTRENANVGGPEYEAARKMMRDAIEESFPDVLLEPISDFLEGRASNNIFKV